MVIGKVLNDKSISLNWKQPHQPNGIILGYDILYYSYKEEGDVENKMVTKLRLCYVLSRTLIGKWV